MSGLWGNPQPMFQSFGSMPKLDYKEEYSDDRISQILKREHDDSFSRGMSLCAICNVCGGNSISNCACVRARNPLQINPTKIHTKRIALINSELIDSQAQKSKIDSRIEYLTRARDWAHTLNKPPVTHHGIRCDQCQVGPIVGARYKCTTCADYDLCGKCMLEFNHTDGHAFLKMPAPTTVVENGRGASTNEPTMR